MERSQENNRFERSSLWDVEAGRPASILPAAPPPKKYETLGAILNKLKSGLMLSLLVMGGGRQ